MGHLAAESHRLLQASLADATHSVYQRGVSTFEQFRGKLGLMLTWPAPCSHVVAFISSMSLEGKAPATISSYLAGIAFWHKINGWEDPSKAFIVQKLVEGSKRLNGSPDSRAPLTLPLLIDILGALNKVCTSSYETILFRAAFSLAFFAFLRVGEFTAKSRSDKGTKIIAVSDVAFEGEGPRALKIILRYSKTDQVGHASILTINAAGATKVCPVSAINSFLSVRPKCAGPLFVHMDQSPLTRYQFQSILQKSLEFSGHSACRFSTHSFRIGAATTAAICGFDSEDIKRLGRWKSGAFRLYIRPSEFLPKHM